MARGPSAKTIAQYLRIPKEAANAIKKSMNGGKIDATMQLANQLMKGHGVEAVQSEYIWVGSYWHNTGLLYVNKGDTYDMTLCYDTEKRYFFVGSWGDWVERSHWFRRHWRK